MVWCGVSIVGGVSSVSGVSGVVIKRAAMSVVSLSRSAQGQGCLRNSLLS